MSVFNFSLPLVTAALVCSHTASATSFGGGVIQRQLLNFQNSLSNLKSCNDKIISAPVTRLFQSKYMTNNVCHWGGEDKCKSISNEEFTKGTTWNNATINTTNKIEEITIYFKKDNGAKNKTKAQSIYKKPNKFYTSREERGLLPFKKTLSELERQNAPYTLVKKDSLDLTKQDIYVPAKDLKLCIKPFSKKSLSPSQQNIEKWTKDVNTAYRESSEYVKKSMMGSNFCDCLDELRKKTERLKLNVTSTLSYIKDKSKSISLPRTAERKELLTKCNFIRQQVLEAPDITAVQNLPRICKRANICNTFVRKLDKAKIESRPLKDVVKEARKVLSSQNTSWTMNQKINYLIYLRNFNEKLAELLNYHGPKIKIKLSERTKQNIKYLAYKEGAVKTRKNNKVIFHDNFSTKSTFDSATKSKNQFCDSSYNKFKTTRTPYIKKSAASVSATNVSEYTKIYMPPVQFYGSSYNTCKTTGTPYIKKSATGVSATNVSEYTRYTMIYILPAK